MRTTADEGRSGGAGDRRREGEVFHGRGGRATGQHHLPFHVSSFVEVASLPEPRAMGVFLVFPKGGPYFSRSVTGNQRPGPGTLRRNSMPHNVALFVTCLTDQFYPHVGVAVTKILERFGCTVSFPDAQTCCGQPFYNNGFHDEAAGLAKRMVEIFESYDYIVTPSGSCCAMVREHFPHLLHGDPAWEPGMKR